KRIRAELASGSSHSSRRHGRRLPGSVRWSRTVLPRFLSLHEAPMTRILASPLVLLTIVALLASAPSARAAQTDKLPNIVLIFIDDLGYGDIGPFGNTKVRTPHLDQMAKEGMKFTHFYATPVCSMSRACLMTGCYNARVSIPGVLFPGSNIGL